MANNKGTYIEADKCSFCGLPITEVGVLFSGADGAAICDQCIERGYETLMDRQMAEEQLLREETKLQREDLMKPAEIKEFLDQYVIGQDDAKKTLAVAVYNHYKRLMHAEAETRKEDEVEIDKSNIIMVGETGTGKELFAQAIHNDGPRRNRPFVAINCGAIPKELLESELFGYEPGAFSGANSGGQKGLLEQAHTGTFFLDEVSEMPVSLQVKLLRVLQERVVRRVGGKVNHSVDIRIIAASNRNLRELVAQGAFREDLFFRLDVIPLFVPPLRERQGDIRLLVAHFLQSFSRERGCTYRVATELMHAFEAYPWPGNVRELRNFAERMVILFGGKTVLPVDLPPEMTPQGKPEPSAEAASAACEPAFLPQSAVLGPDLDFKKARAVFEARYLEAKLHECGGNITRLAETIGLERSYLHRKLKGYGISSE